MTAIDLEILDPNSALRACAQQYAVILLSSEKLKARLYASIDRRMFGGETVGRLKSLWGAFSAHSQAMLIQSTFVRLRQLRAEGGRFHRLYFHRYQLSAVRQGARAGYA